MIKKLLFLAALLFGSYFQAISQDCQVFVQVNDSDGEPIIAAAVSLIQNGAVITAGYTGVDGNVMLSGFDPGEYTVKVSYLRNEAEQKIKVNEGLNRHTIRLKPNKIAQRTICFGTSNKSSFFQSPYGSGDRLTHLRCRHI